MEEEELDVEEKEDMIEITSLNVIFTDMPKEIKYKEIKT